MGTPKRIVKASSKPKTTRKVTAVKADADEVLKEKVIMTAVKASRGAALLTSPRVSEKAAILASHGTYVFNVTIDANKVEIRKAIEALYQVSVVSVRTVRSIGKMVRRGRTMGRRNRSKKAIVTLKEGQRIELYPGV